MFTDDLSPIDEALLETLAIALLSDPPPACEPSSDELANLAAAVADDQELRQGRGSERPTRDTSDRLVPIGIGPRRARRHAPRLVALLGAATILAGTGAAAAASGVVGLPRPVRQAAYDLGLPWAKSPKLGDIRHSLGDLARARATHDSVAARAAVARLARQYNELDGAERKQIQPAVEQQAPALLGRIVGTSSLDTAPSPSADTQPAHSEAPPAQPDARATQWEAPPAQSDTPAAPASSDTQPAPAGAPQAPSDALALPSGPQPAPSDAQPAPSDTQAAPSESPAPAGAPPAGGNTGHIQP